MSHSVVWVHGDNLSPYSPALKANKESPSLFVFDDELLDRYGVTLKRMVFLYECLLELPVVIRRGKVADEVARFAEEHKTRSIVTNASPAPRFAKIVEALKSRGFELDVLSPPSFVPDQDYDLKRFSRYWRKAKTRAFQVPSL